MDIRVRVCLCQFFFLKFRDSGINDEFFTPWKIIRSKKFLFVESKAWVLKDVIEQKYGIFIGYMSLLSIERPYSPDQPRLLQIM